MPGTMPVKNETSTQTRRTIVGSTSMYSAIPPQTPAIFTSTDERIRRF